MDSKLALLRNMAEQQEYSALQQTCREQLVQVDSRPVQILLALSFAHLNEPESARNILNRVLETALSDPLIFAEQQDMSAVYIAITDYQSAELTLDCLLQKEPTNALNLARKAYCRLMLGDNRGAYPLYVQSLEHDPSKVEVWVNLCLLILVNHSDVRGDLGLDCIHPLELVWLNLAQAEAQLEQMQESTYFQANTKSDVGYAAQRLEGLARQLDAIRLECWVLEGKLAEAEVWLDAHSEEGQRYRDNVLVYAECLFQHGNGFVAEATLLNAAKRFPDDAELYRQLAIFAYDQNRIADAQYYQSQYDSRTFNSGEHWAFGQNVSALSVVDFKDSARIRARFNRDFLSTRLLPIEQGESLKDLQPVFIVGVPFSGLSLVEQILVCSDQVASLGASSHFPVLVEALNYQHRKKGSSRYYPDLVDTLGLEQLGDIAQGLHSLYYGKVSDAPVVIDKSIHNICHIGLIKSIFPNAKIISVRRDPRALALSSSVSNWLEPHLGQFMASNDNESMTVSSLLGQQLAQYNSLLTHWKSLFADSILEVSFEELTSKGNFVAARLFDFLDLSVPDHIEQKVRTVAQYAPDDASIKWSNHKLELSFLLRAMSKKTPVLVRDMVTLPEANILSLAYEYYTQGAYRESEYQCKVLLHHLPDFAPAHYLLGEIYIRNGLIPMGVEYLSRAIDLAPWKSQQWQPNLIRARTLLESQGTSKEPLQPTRSKFYREAK